MKSVRRICTLLIGIVFLLSGLLKLMDPLGASLIVEEYLKFLHLGFAMPVSRVLAVALSLVESLVGAALISGVLPLVTGPFSALLIFFFTVLTFILWIVNPPMDCGCFGEAVHLTHAQSLVKNLVLCGLWLVAFMPPGNFPRPRRDRTVAFAIGALSIVLFAIWFNLRLPAIDFTPFKPGATLMQAELSPMSDSPLLSVSDSNGNYKDELLARGPVLLVSAYSPERLSPAAELRAAELVETARELGFAAYTLTPGGTLGPEPLASDRRTLLTLNRSNGGATLISDGMIITKWPAAKYPSTEQLGELRDSDPTEAMMTTTGSYRLRLEAFLLYLFAVLLLL